MSEGALFIVGLGPGDREHLSGVALEALDRADVIIGYKTYIDLIRDDSDQSKRYLSSGMKNELFRAKEAIALAKSGQTVAIVSSGDPGIYGMAGPVLELAPDASFPIEVVPGISALSAAASALGAPLMHDFCAISLSDLLTPWEVIARRLEAAASADFVTCLYNPKSHGRPDNIDRAREIFLQHRAAENVVGIVRNARRGAESTVVSDLDSFTGEEIDMLTTVIIGNSQTKLVGDRMVTPRGYRL